MFDPIYCNPTPIASTGESSGTHTQFGYEAIEERGQRRRGTAVIQSEDRELTHAQRAKLIGSTRDVIRNYALVGWMVRRHLDYVTQFHFQCNTNDDDFNTALEQRVEQRCRRMNCDVRGQFTLDKYIRTAELCKVRDGDLGTTYMRSGHLQAIEGDRIRTPNLNDYGNPVDSKQWFNGVRVNGAGRPLEYGIWNRISGGPSMIFDRTVNARNFYLLANVDRFDQVRGVSPIASAMNNLVDLKENITYALLKSKVAQFFGLVLKRSDEDSAGEVTNDGTNGDEKNAFEVDFGRGPFTLDLNIDEDASFLTTNVPGDSFKEFHELVMMIVLKCLDLPMAFFDEARTNFFASKGAWLMYDRACISKRDDVAELLNWVTVKDLLRWIVDPLDPLVLPAGYTIGTLPFEWVPRGMPWWDKGKEVDADIAAIGAGLSNPYAVCRRTDSDYEENIRLIARARKFARDAGQEILGEPIEVSFVPGPKPTQVEVTNQPEESNQ